MTISAFQKNERVFYGHLCGHYCGGRLHLLFTFFGYFMKLFDSLTIALLGIYAMLSGYQIASMKSEIVELKQKVEILQTVCHKDVKK